VRALDLLQHLHPVDLHDAPAQEQHRATRPGQGCDQLHMTHSVGSGPRVGEGVKGHGRLDLVGDQPFDAAPGQPGQAVYRQLLVDRLIELVRTTRCTSGSSITVLMRSR
jgi:hypothetical protein